MSSNSATGTSSCPICQGVGFYTLDVGPGHAAFGQAIECRCHREQRLKLEQAALLARSGCEPRALEAYAFDLFVPAQAVGGRAAQTAAERVKAVCEAYAREPQGWLVLVGGTGSGKTHLAYAIAREALGRGLGAMWATVPDMLDSLRASYEADAYEETMRALGQAPLVVLDDLGTEQATPWAVEKLFQIVNGRYNRRLPLVVTSNVDVRSGRIEERIRSRLLDGRLARMLVLPMGDYRQRRG